MQPTGPHSSEPVVTHLSRRSSAWASQSASLQLYGLHTITPQAAMPLPSLLFHGNTCLSPATPLLWSFTLTIQGGGGFVLEKDKKKTSDLLDCLLPAIRTENNQINADLMEAASWFQ